MNVSWSQEKKKKSIPKLSTTHAGNGVAGVLDVYGCALADNSPVVIYPDDGGQVYCRVCVCVCVCVCVLLCETARPQTVIVLALQWLNSLQGTCGGRNQIWTRTAKGNLINQNSQKCLDVYDFAGPQVRCTLLIALCERVLEISATHTYIYIHVHTCTYARTCTHVHICTHMHLIYAQVEQWSCNGGANQEWYFASGPSVRTNQSGQCLTAVAPSEEVCLSVS
jgi:hypothetical protein